VALRQLVPGFEGDELHPPELLAPLAAALGAEDVQLYYQTAICGRRDLKLAPDPHTGFRMTLLRMLAFRPAAAAQGATGGGARSADRGSAPRATAHSPAAAAPPVAGAAAGLPDWPTLLGSLELTGAARQLAGHCVLLGHERGVVRLALDPRSNVVRTPAMEEKLAQALTRHFGEPTRVAIELREAQAETPAQATERNSRQLQQAALTALEADPVVQGALKQFGATIHPDSVRPAKPV